MSAGALPQTPLGELTALFRSPFRGLLLKGDREGMEWKEMEENVELYHLYYF